MHNKLLQIVKGFELVKNLSENKEGSTTTVAGSMDTIFGLMPELSQVVSNLEVVASIKPSFQSAAHLYTLPRSTCKINLDDPVTVLRNITQFSTYHNNNSGGVNEELTTTLALSSRLCSLREVEIPLTLIKRSTKRHQLVAATSELIASRIMNRQSQSTSRKSVEKSGGLMTISTSAWAVLKRVTGVKIPALRIPAVLRNRRAWEISNCPGNASRVFASA